MNRCTPKQAELLDAGVKSSVNCLRYEKDVLRDLQYLFTHVFWAGRSGCRRWRWTFAEIDCGMPTPRTEVFGMSWPWGSPSSSPRALVACPHPLLPSALRGDNRKPPLFWARIECTSDCKIMREPCQAFGLYLALLNRTHFEARTDATSMDHAHEDRD